jgi:hypothetical protein
MTAQLRIGDLARHHSNSNGRQPARGGTLASPLTDAVVGAAVLVSAAFRMRDEASLVTALRELATAVAAMERAEPAADEGQTPST